MAANSPLEKRGNSSQSQPKPLGETWANGSDARIQAWQQEKEQVIQTAIQSSFTDIFELLNFLAEERQKIAYKMDRIPPRADTGGKAKDFGCWRKHEDTFIAYTPLNTHVYEFYIPTLLELYAALSGPNIVTNKEECKTYIPRKDHWRLDERATSIKTIHDFNLRYSTILLCRPANCPMSELPEFTIFHTPIADQIKIFERIKNLFSMMDAASPELKIILILAMAFHLGQAMFWNRGSASIVEMFITVLCKKYDIEINLEKLLIPLDLISIFSSSSQNMVQNLCYIFAKQAFDPNSDNSEPRLDSDYSLSALAEIFPILSNNNEKIPSFKEKLTVQDIKPNMDDGMSLEDESVEDDQSSHFSPASNNSEQSFVDTFLRFFPVFDKTNRGSEQDKQNPFRFQVNGK